MAPNRRGGSKGGHKAGGGGGDDRNNGGNPDRSRSPIRGDRTPPEAPPRPQTGIPTSTNRGPPAPSALTSFAEDYRTLGTPGKRLIFRLILEELAEPCRNRPPRTYSPKFDDLTRQLEGWLRLSDAERRVRLNQEFSGWGFQDIDQAFARIRLARPAGSVGIMFDIAHEWLTAPQNVKEEFLNCLTDDPTQFAHAFLALAPQTKDLLRRFG